jgi:hypothetical protein
MSSIHRHLTNIDCLTATTACLVCFSSTLNGRSEKKKPIKTNTSSRHITNLKQSILETVDIYASIQSYLIEQHLVQIFTGYRGQGSLAEREGSIQFTSLYSLV